MFSRGGRAGWLALVGSLSVAFGSAAPAQSVFDRTANITVQDRPRPEYDPLGLPLGVGFVIYPKVTLGAIYDDNVTDLPSSDLLDELAQQLPASQRFTQFTDRLRPLADAQATIEPNLTVRSNWNQNSLEITADGVFTRSASYPGFSARYPTPDRTAFENSDQYSVAAAGVLNVRHDLTISLDASYGRLLLPRTFDGYVIVASAPSALAVATSIAPLYADEAEAKVEIVKDFARFRLTAGGQFQTFDYSNGFGPTFTFTAIDPAGQPDPAQSSVTSGPIVQTFHNHAGGTESLRGDYGFTSDLAVFVEETVTETQYPNIRLRDRFDEETLVGVNFQIPGLITAEIGVGNLYSHVSYSGLKAVDTPDYRAKITYFPTPLIDVTLTAGEYIVDSGVPAAPDYLDRTVGLQVNYELLRNLILTGEASLNLEDYRGLDRHARIHDEGLGATYLMNRAMRVSLAYGHRQHASSGSQAVARRFNEFNDNRVSLAFTLQH